MARKAYVAGQFYPENPQLLKLEVEEYIKAGAAQEEKAIAMITPHAGYMYSGRIAGGVFAKVKIPDTVILMGPNHTGVGERISVSVRGDWEIPTGIVQVNDELADELVETSSLFVADEFAHAREHALEVQLPFIHFKNPSATIVPICIKPAGYETCEKMGKYLAKAIRTYKRDVLIIVSSDMNHYEPDSVTRVKDKAALDRILALDAKGLLEVTGEKDISMCGAVPAAIAIVAAKELGATGAKQSGYGTSADASGDTEHVVGYAGVVIK